MIDRYPDPVGSPPLCVAIRAVAGCQLLDVTGPYELFASAQRPGFPSRAYRVLLVTPEGSHVETEAGLRLETQATIADLAASSIDTLIVADGPGPRQTPLAGPLGDWTTDTARTCRRVATVCTGAFLLARPAPVLAVRQPQETAVGGGSRGAVGMSPRTFARRFRETVGETPAAFVERARLDAARRRLEYPGATVDRVAAETGFMNAERMRRSFRRAFGVSPAEYRRQFGAPAGSADPPD